MCSTEYPARAIDHMHNYMIVLTYVWGLHPLYYMFPVIFTQQISKHNVSISQNAQSHNWLCWISYVIHMYLHICEHIVEGIG